MQTADQALHQDRHLLFERGVEEGVQNFIGEVVAEAFDLRLDGMGQFVLGVGAGGVVGVETKGGKKSVHGEDLAKKRTG